MCTTLQFRLNLLTLTPASRINDPWSGCGFSFWIICNGPRHSRTPFSSSSSLFFFVLFLSLDDPVQVPSNCWAASKGCWKRQICSTFPHALFKRRNYNRSKISLVLITHHTSSVRNLCTQVLRNLSLHVILSQEPLRAFTQ